MSGPNASVHAPRPSVEHLIPPSHLKTRQFRLHTRFVNSRETFVVSSLIEKVLYLIMMNLLSLLGALLFCSPYVLSAPSAPVVANSSSHYSPCIQKIISNAKADGIDLLALPFAASAFAGIEEIQKPVKLNHTVKAERICVHGSWLKNPIRVF